MTTLTRKVADRLQKTDRMSEVPPAKTAAKVVTTLVGLGIALFGVLLTGAGVYVLIKLPFTNWLLLMPAAGIAIVLVGGIVMSKDVAMALLEVVTITRGFASAVRGKNGEPPAAGQ